MAVFWAFSVLELSRVSINEHWIGSYRSPRARIRVMIRKALQTVPEKWTDRFALYALAVMVGYVIGWISHPDCAMWWAT